MPSDGLFAQYYAQAVNKNAPHPAAARLWQEYLYSDEGQNLWLAGKARPVRLDAMTDAGTVDKALLAALPAGAGRAAVPDAGRDGRRPADGRADVGERDGVSEPARPRSAAAP